MASELRFLPELADLSGYKYLAVAGQKSMLLHEATQAALPASVREVWRSMVDSLSPGDNGATTATWLTGSPARVSVLAISDRASRHNVPTRPDVLASYVAGIASKPGKTLLIVAVPSADAAVSTASAVARAFPLYKNSIRKPSSASLDVAILTGDGSTTDATHLSIVAASVREAARLVDMPPSELNTTAFVARAVEIANEVGAQVDVIDFAQLEERGFGGLVGVGKASTHKPALVHLKYTPASSRARVSWVGKGIVFDTGGLSIKGKSHMPGMKTDMGGAAAVLGAFQAAAKLELPYTIDALLCLAENSVGPDSTRPDDILHMYSGKRVEVNNTDAEGRLVLGDGVAYAAKHLSPTVIVDLATLTGAQLIATGKAHAAIMANNEAIEVDAVAAGKRCGDLTHPLPYAPEFFRGEFKSKVADLKNSVKDRMNAQSSCAGQFIAEHLGDYKGSWLHVDIAGPSSSKGRGTGYGVALLLELFNGDYLK